MYIDIDIDIVYYYYIVMCMEFKSYPIEAHCTHKIGGFSARYDECQSINKHPSTRASMQEVAHSTGK